VDPTVGAAVRALGYDRDFAQVRAMEARRGTGRAGPPAEPARPAPGWWRLHWGPGQPRGAAAPRCDARPRRDRQGAGRRPRRAPGRRGDRLRCAGRLGGDLGIAGTPPEGGWRVAVADDHRDALDTPAQTISVASGGLATSSTVARAWRHGGRRRHHIVDPRTGENPVPLWRTVSVAAGSCVDANTASTAAIVLGRAATDWLVRRGMPARLVTEDGQVVHTAGWPLTEEGG